ncbi:hypothetical protein UNDYM_1674 [Undibacterium sp. YM2]|uniref:hypothetical protein n=1 Tax=Undibacterium sp. YM2 TaxID=2058625 RepID=UPI001331E207|nr:hypothetical protein [Undibacterium sp. YM2]BBB65927.1 hypothetical protein UNDYM_1674 [Undibacterium sp. YM2]
MSVDHRLTPLKKSNLQYEYSDHHTSGDDPKLRNHPDSDLLSRDEWYEVLYFCNKFANTHTTTAPFETALKVERLLKLNVPPALHSRTKITDWLERNWPMFPKV